jgi:hypothetical protein
VEERTGAELELAGVGGEDLHPGHVGGHEVRGELDARVAQPAHPGQSLGERGLADAGSVLQEEMASGDHGGEGQLHGASLASDHPGQGIGGAGQELGCGGGRVGGKGQGRGSHGAPPV